MLGRAKRTQKGFIQISSSKRKDDDERYGGKCKTPEENAEVFRCHFEKLYGREPSFDRAVIDNLEQQPITQGHDHLPTDDEIRKAVRKLKNKAPGDSGLSPQLWKALALDDNTYKI